MDEPKTLLAMTPEEVGQEVWRVMAMHGGMRHSYYRLSKDCAEACADAVEDMGGTVLSVRRYVLAEECRTNSRESGGKAE